MTNEGPVEIRCARAAAAAAPAFSRVLAATAFALAVLAVPHAHAATYKWVDENGVTHYSDKLPPEAINRANVELNKQGVPVKKVDPAPSAEQLRAKQAEIERAQAQAREQEVTGRRDRALLQSYTTEGEIDLARTRALSTIQSQLQSAEAFSNLLIKRRDLLNAKKAGAGLSVAEDRELEGANAEIAKQQTLIELKKKERETALARYDADKARWRELRSIADANAQAAAGVGLRSSAGGPQAAPTAVTSPAPSAGATSPRK